MKINQELLTEANKIDFKLTKTGGINYRKHSVYERGLYFIKNALRVHGMDKYHYGLVLDHYVGNNTKVPIICPVHGEFLVTPGNHYMGKGCARCCSTYAYSTEELVEKARKVHGDRYDYSNVVYKTAKEKILIRCKVHGIFEQTPDSHIHGKGCAKCANRYTPTTEEWIERARKVHGDLYDYSNVVYKKAHEKVTIICSTHGPFEQEANNHLAGYGCIRCGNAYSCTTEEWVEKAKAVHGDCYDYSNVVYKTSKEKILIRCLIHGDFLQQAASHLSGKGCPKCAGHNHNILYLLKCLDTGWYKIGITTDNIQKRLTSLGGNIEEVHHILVEDPREHELYLHKLYEKDREYNPCVKSGNTEFFSLTKEQEAQIRQYMASIAINQKSI